MKKVKIKPLHCLLSLIALLVLLGGALIFSACSASAASTYGGGDYRYEFESYDVEYDISSDCAISVTEIINVHYMGWNSTGLLRDIPVNAGAQVKNINVTGIQLISGGTEVPYKVIIENNDFITIDIGSYVNKTNKNEIYRITYDYFISNSVVNGNILSINPIGTGNDCEIKNATVKLTLPNGYQSAVRYVGKKGSTAYDTDFVVGTENGRTVLTTSATNLNNFEGITFDITFASGSIHAHFDFTPYWFVIAAAVILLILILLKLLVFNKVIITPIVNFEAPDGMDPLMMGKLIDNTVNAEDVTALIFYWADKGYLKINLNNEDNPTLIRIKNLPETATKYEQIVFNGLFRKGDAVATDDLKYVFYKTYEQAKTAVNSMTKGLHKSWSIGISILFVLLSGLLIGIAPIVLGMTTISASLTFPYGFIALIPALILYGFSESVKYNRLKRKRTKNALYYILLALGILVCSGIFMIVIPPSLLPTLPKFLLCVLSFVSAATSVVLISRTSDYNEKLNHIIGFRDFIKYAEKDRLEALLASDPQYYYHVLPYAQVLNVSDIWADKFKGITVAPPTWATSSFDMFDFVLLNNVINNSTRSLTTGMISRPSSSGSNGGGHFGGGFGGFSGGGFGGGGSRGR